MSESETVSVTLCGRHKTEQNAKDWQHKFRRQEQSKYGQEQNRI
jgi:hypothetical protein